MTLRSLGLAFLGLLSLSAFGSPERRLMPGDMIQIVCQEDSGLTVIRTIGPDGLVALPGVGAVGIATKYPSVAAEILSNILIDSGTLDQATIQVIPLLTKGAAIEIQGAVTHPLALRFSRSVKLSEMLRIASPAASAELEQVSISRGDGSFLSVDSTLHDISLWDGDRIYVSMAKGGNSVNVLGGVGSPSSVSFQRGMTVRDAIRLAGGITGYGDKTQVILERSGEPLPLNFPEDEGTVVRPGDTVRVGLRKEKRSLVVKGPVLHPGLIDFYEGMTLTKAIEAAGGILSGNVPDEVWIKKVVGKEIKSYRLSLTFLYARRIPDPVLQPDEIVQIGGKG